MFALPDVTTIPARLAQAGIGYDRIQFDGSTVRITFPPETSDEMIAAASAICAAGGKDMVTHNMPRAAALAAVTDLQQLIAGADTATTAQLRAGLKRLAQIQLAILKHLLKVT